MRLSKWLLSTVILANDLSFTLAQPLTSRRSIISLSSLDLKRHQGNTQDLIERSPQQNDDNGNLSLDSSTSTTNASTANACISALASVTSVSNPAGFAACYNILDWQPNTETFQADLRLYQVSSATDAFANLAMNDIALLLNFPSDTQFQILMNSKRDISNIETRQNSMQQIQQYSLLGTFKTKLDLNKLNETELASLMVPQIVLEPKATEQPQISANLSSSDMVYFQTGQFTNLASSTQLLSQITNSNLADYAFTASAPFVLPGTHLGIFPIGLIITGSWCVLFFLAFGLGTIGRIRHRNAYRKRIALERARMMPRKL